MKAGSRVLSGNGAHSTRTGKRIGDFRHLKRNGAKYGLL